MLQIKWWIRSLISGGVYVALLLLPTYALSATPCYPGAPAGVPCEGIAARAAVEQALYAGEQGEIAWWQFALNVGTLAAAGAAAYFAWLAAHQTKRAADAAKAQISAMEESAKRQLRAYTNLR